jgi:hypothetical protein
VNEKYYQKSRKGAENDLSRTIKVCNRFGVNYLTFGWVYKYNRRDDGYAHIHSFYTGTHINSRSSNCNTYTTTPNSNTNPSSANRYTDACSTNRHTHTCFTGTYAYADCGIKGACCR